MRIVKYLLHNLSRSPSSFFGKDGDLLRLCIAESTTGLKKEERRKKKREYIRGWSERSRFFAMRRTSLSCTHVHKSLVVPLVLVRQLHPILPTYVSAFSVSFAHVNGALLHSQRPPHVCTFVPNPLFRGYSRIFSSQWLWNRAFSLPRLCLPLFVARPSLLFRGIADALEPPWCSTPKPLVEFRSGMSIDTGLTSEEHQFRAAANCICLATAAPTSFSLSRERRISDFFV